LAKRISTEDHPELGVGHALIRIRASGLPEEPGHVFFKRPRHAQPDLGPAGWQSGEHALDVRQVEFDGPDLLITVGPDVVGYMETGNYQLEIVGAAGADRFTATMRWKNVTPCKPPGSSSGAGSGLDAGAGKRAEEPPPAVQVGAAGDDAPASEVSAVGEAADPKSTPETEPAVDEPSTAPAGNKRAILIGAVVAVLLLAVAGVVILLPDGGSPPKTTTTGEKPPEPAADAGFDRKSWAQRGAVEQFRRGQEFMAQAEGAEDADELKGHAEWLFDSAKDQGSADAALALARLYDPRELTPGRSQQLPPDLNSAYRAYRQAQELGSPEADAELCGLRSLVEQLSEEGDSSARMLLRRPWPECAA
jgi:hypothetical protein